MFTGGSPRYQVYATADSRYLTAAPLETRFWQRFCDLIQLAEEFRDDALNPQATTAAVSKLIKAHPAAYWQARFENQDVCCCLVKNLQEVVEAGQFSGDLEAGSSLGDIEVGPIPSMPLPVVEQFRVNSGSCTSPDLNEGNGLLATGNGGVSL